MRGKAFSLVFLSLLSTAFILFTIGCGGGNASGPSPLVPTSGGTVAPPAGAPTPSPTPTPSPAPTPSPTPTPAPGGTPGSGGTFLYVGTQPDVPSSATPAAILGFRLNVDGTLSPIAGSPFSFVSERLGVVGKNLVSGGNTELDLLKIDAASGALTKAFSTQVVPSPSSTNPFGFVSIAGNESFVYLGTSNGLYGYSLTADQLQLLPGFPMDSDDASTGQHFYFLETVQKGFLFFTVEGFHGTGGVGINRVNADGSLSGVNHSDTSPACAGGTTAGSIWVNPSTSMIYENFTGYSLLIAPFDAISGTLGCARLTSQSSFSGVFEPAGNRAYAAGVIYTSPSQGVPAIAVYNANQTSGDLTPAAGSPFLVDVADGTRQISPFAVDPSGKYLFTIDSRSDGENDLGVYLLSGQTGAPTLIHRYSLIQKGGYVSAQVMSSH